MKENLLTLKIYVIIIIIINIYFIFYYYCYCYYSVIFFPFAYKKKEKKITFLKNAYCPKKTRNKNFCHFAPPDKGDTKTNYKQTPSTRATASGDQKLPKPNKKNGSPLQQWSKR